MAGLNYYIASPGAAGLPSPPESSGIAHNGLYWFATQHTMQSAVLYGDDKTFVFYMGNDYDNWCVVYDHLAAAWGAPVEVADGHTTNDAHNYLSAAIDLSGYIYIFYGCHLSSMYYKKSSSPYDVSAWSGETILASYATYPKTVVDSSDNIYIFYRDGVLGGYGRYFRFRKSTDGGSSWAAAVTVIDSGVYNTSVYAGVIGLGSDDSLHVIWTWRDQSGGAQEEFHDVCYMKSLDGGTTWKKSDGTNYALPIDVAAAEEIASGDYLFAQHVALDGSNNPHVVYVETEISSYFTENEIHYCYLSGGVWQNVTMSGVDYDLSTHIVIDGTTFYIFSAQIVVNHREIIMFKSVDSGANWTFYQLTSSSTIDNVNVAAKLNAVGGIEIVWNNGNGSDVNVGASTDVEYMHEDSF